MNRWPKLSKETSCGKLALMLDLPDVNVLVALVLPDHVHHDRAQAWWASVEHCATTPTTEMGLVRLLLQPAVVGAVVSFDAAMTVLQSVVSDPRSTFLADDVPVLSMADLPVVGSKQVTDMHLVTLAQKHRAHLVTLDAKLASSLSEPARQTVALI